MESDDDVRSCAIGGRPVVVTENRTHKRITLLRHAKSSWSNANLGDRDRPLNHRGKRDAPVMARRLVAAGVRFVSVDYGGWDNHKSIREAYLDKGPALDHAIAGLISDLDQRGMLDETLVMVTTEFGRTPRVNTSNGRDHWARSYSMMLAGGGITRGQIYGASDATANEPDKNPVSLEDFLSTVYHQLGIDSNKELLAFGTRPIEIVKGGQVVKGLLA